MTERIHVLPVNDLIDHEDSGDCVCGPDTEFTEGGAVITHHSLDGRELCHDCEQEPWTAEDTAGRRFCDKCCGRHGMFPGEKPRA
jgi:hypothetical protein